MENIQYSIGLIAEAIAEKEDEKNELIDETDVE